MTNKNMKALQKMADRSVIFRQIGEYTKEFKRLGAQHDSVPKGQQNEIFDQMTDLVNKIRALRDQVHGCRSKPIRIRFSSRRVVRK